MRKSTLIALLVAGSLLIPAAVYASHQFTDVPDSNQFHSHIAWMKDNNITVGCNPPANTQYCPGENVTRGQMAAFMKRLAENNVVDAATLDGKEPAEIASAFGDSGPTGITQTLAGIGTLEQIQVQAPAAGYFQVLGSASFAETAPGSTTLVWIQVDNTVCINTAASVAAVGFGYANTSSATALVGGGLAEGYAAVTAGAHTITLCGNQFLGTNVDVVGPSISALFLTDVTISAGLYSATDGDIPGTE